VIDRSAADSSRLELPQGLASGAAEFGSDVIAETLRALDVGYVALNPGASFRGLHDSLVNFLGNRDPTMLLCLHEEHAVAIAHGWAKVTGRPMAAILHSNVGLMHGSMAIFNAWCDRAPIIVLGATGPVDAALRRPWIDWLHTARDQGALVRGFVKWDDQPASVAASVESLLRAHRLASTAPRAPVYLNFDAALQEARLVERAPAARVARYAPPPPARPDPAVLERAARALGNARRPLILVGRVSRSESDWKRRIDLAERLGALVLTDLKQAAGFPTEHRLHGAPAGMFPSPEARALIRQADVILSLDWVDLGGAIKAACGAIDASATIIQASVDQQLHNGWSFDHQALAPSDLSLLVEPDIAVADLLPALEGQVEAGNRWQGVSPAPVAAAPSQPSGALEIRDVATALRRVIAGRPACLIRTPLSWAGDFWPLAHPLDMLGYDGGGGVGSGPGMAVGAALALKGAGRLPIAIIGDGDFLMGATAIWTAAHYEIPLLLVIANNRSFFNDELHQDRMARLRGRPVENRWIGQRIADPDIDIAALARAQGAAGFGPAPDVTRLEADLALAVAAVERGQVAVVDARIAPGYGGAMTAALTRDPAEGR
jgi:thiamine pyrophosphate-dependent acetolactate synthase large subunit-like protein